MNSIILHHHLGLGDHFVCNGLVHEVSERYDTLYLPCKAHNYSTIEYLYSESPKIKIFKINENEFKEVFLFSKLLNLDIISIGFQYCNPQNWDRSFYEQIGLNFSNRYESFYLPKKNPNKVINPPKEDYVLVHKQASNSSYEINIKTNAKIIEIVKEDNFVNLFSYIELIKNAKEIHCINSSIFHLIDSISFITNNLYYHDVRKNDGTKFTISKKWKIIK